MKYVSLMLALALIPSRVFATVHAIYFDGNRVFVASDSQRTTSSEGCKPNKYEKVCKPRANKSAVTVLIGETFSFETKNGRPVMPHVVAHDLVEESGEILSNPSLSFEEMVKQIRDATGIVVTNNYQFDQQCGPIDGEGVFVVGNIVRYNQGNFTWTEFGERRERDASASHDGGQEVVMKRDDFFWLSPEMMKDPIGAKYRQKFAEHSSDPIKLLYDFMSEESNRHPLDVGPPFSLIEVSRTETRLIQSKNGMFADGEKICRDKYKLLVDSSKATK